MWQNKYLATFAIVIVELVIICLLVPCSVIEKAINQEYEMSVRFIGQESTDHVYDRAKSDYEELIISSGLYEAVVRHLIPTEEEKRASVGMEQLGTKDGWFSLVQSRINAATTVIYQILIRFESVWLWLPYVGCFVLLPSVICGYWQRRIKQTNFDFSSPLATNMTVKFMVYSFLVGMMLVVVPMPINPLFVPLYMILLCILIGRAVANIQKRL